MLVESFYIASYMLSALSLFSAAATVTDSFVYDYLI